MRIARIRLRVLVGWTGGFRLVVAEITPSLLFERSWKQSWTPKAQQATTAVTTHFSFVRGALIKPN
jgi:hypothetical protein